MCFPGMERFAEYAEIQAVGFRNGNGGASATDFYRENRDAMDGGSQIAWPEHFNYDELSAVLHAMNLKLQDEAPSSAEYQ